MNFLLLSLLAPATSAAPAVPTADSAEIVEVERAFAAMAEEKGVSTAFKSFVAEDGILFTPDPEPARTFLEEEGETLGRLRWWPVLAGIAQSGDLGFTTGPYVQEAEGRNGQGWYFTIWRRQPDGSWRWVLDHGTPTAQRSTLSTETPTSALAPGRVGGTGAAGELAAIEGRLNRGLASDAPSALAKILADDGRVMRAGAQPAIGREAFSVALLRGPVRVEAVRLAGGISEAGDLAYSYGAAAWVGRAGPVEGHYVRLWQRRAGGWRLVIDKLTPRPRKAEPTATAAAAGAVAN